ncbi:Pycsar system effector family protein [Flavobacterium sp. AG291]|uniref:Pycsar system effector family protein n=1 Tax=Flavobacterium sp. AG291 TaxID=2184000 RepID=UPI000E0BD091|nr:Pycsar system effector family protein [Flavobacterium sp. AG291]RDI16043.1 putative metal-dependent HD superfamily phosphohydrolase [Flavobacterium sp. AG291]
MNIVQEAENFVFGLFKDKLSPDYIYHNFNHTLRVVNNVRIIAAAEGVSKEDTELLLLAAWFHDSAYIDGPVNHEERSGVIAGDFLREKGYGDDAVAKVASLIKVTKLGTSPETRDEKIMRDADCSHFSDPNYCDLSQLLREEWKITQGKEFSDMEWALINRNVLIHEHRFYSDYGKEKLQPLKEANIARLQNVISEIEQKQKDDSKDKEKKEKKEKDKKEKEGKSERGIDTMFRVTLSNHTRLSDIADSKANILLSVNAIIISVSLSTLIPKLDSASNAHLIIPTFIMVFFSVVSIIFAIMSTRPKVTSGTFTRKDIEDKKVNLLFFGNFYKMPITEYEWAMNEMMKDRDYLYNSMIKDLYYLGLVLNRKYKLLRITYTIFMIGIISSVIAFVYAFKAM